MHAARGGGEEEATDYRGRAKSEAPDLGLAVWQNEAHRKNYDDLSLTQRKRKGRADLPDMGLEPMTSRLRVCHSTN